MSDSGLDEAFNEARVLITGGLGFIGSNLAIRLVEAGARVTLVDAMIPEYGANLFNVAPVRDRVVINFGDICDRHAMDWLVRGQDYVFHLAGQVSHVLSMSNPYPDIEYNIKGTVVVMEALLRYNPSARLIFTGTRGQYGPAIHLPVDERAPTNPKAIYEISNLAAEKIILVYHQTHGIRSVLLRLTNVYGPRAQMRHSQYGVVNWFVRLALEGTPIKVFGDGQILRDFLYVDDCVGAMVRCALCERPTERSSTSVSIGRPVFWNWRRCWCACARERGGSSLLSLPSAGPKNRVISIQILTRFDLWLDGSRRRLWRKACGKPWPTTGPIATTTGRPRVRRATGGGPRKDSCRNNMNSDSDLSEPGASATGGPTRRGRSGL